MLCPMAVDQIRVTGGQATLLSLVGQDTLHIDTLHIDTLHGKGTADGSRQQRDLVQLLVL
jgi:hypothetical protein